MSIKGRGHKELKFQDEFSYVDSSTTCDCQFTQITNALVRVGGLSCIHSCMFFGYRSNDERDEPHAQQLTSTFLLGNKNVGRFDTSRFVTN